MQNQKKSETQAYQLHKRLGYRLSRLSKITQERLEERLEVHDMTRLKWCILSSIEWEEIRTPSNLAIHIGINRPAISRALVQMRTQGLLTQKFHNTDGRSRHLALTRKGVDKLLLCRPLVDEVESHFYKKASVKNMMLFEKMLDQLLLGEDALVDKL